MSVIDADTQVIESEHTRWLPFALQRAARGTETGQRLPGHIEPGALREKRLFVACQADDDLPYSLQYAGEDNLVFGTDYGHADTATDLEGHRLLRERRGPQLVRARQACKPQCERALWALNVDGSDVSNCTV